MLTLWYGGTFDPVHLGHLAIARAAAQAFQAPVIMAPAADPPHRPATGATAQQRAKMLELATAGDPWLQVDCRELERDGRSWTVDTLRGLRAELGPHAPLALLLGADSFRSLPTWKSWRELPQLAHFVVAARQSGGDLEALPGELAALVEGRWCSDPQALLERPAGGLYQLDQPLRGESATAVRSAIAQGEPGWQDWVPRPVASFILEQGLYRDG
jgi:nicotinate-nucleotide adenylyltransferase